MPHRRETGSASTAGTPGPDGQVRQDASVDAAHAARGAPPAVPSGDAALLRGELELQKGRLLHLAADFNSYRKRIRRDAEIQAAEAKEQFIRELLPVLDDLERALASGPDSAPAALRQGVTMTVRHLALLLHRHGIEAIDDAGLVFDPHRHEAVAVRHDLQHGEGTVLEVAQRGYRCGDRVFRPAKVVVNGIPSSGTGHAG